MVNDPRHKTIRIDLKLNGPCDNTVVSHSSLLCYRYYPPSTVCYLSTAPSRSTGGFSDFSLAYSSLIDFMRAASESAFVCLTLNNTITHSLKEQTIGLGTKIRQYPKVWQTRLAMRLHGQTCVSLYKVLRNLTSLFRFVKPFSPFKAVELFCLHNQLQKRFKK